MRRVWVVFDQGLAHIVGTLSVLLSCFLVGEYEKLLVRRAWIGSWLRPPWEPIIGKKGLWVDDPVVNWSGSWKRLGNENLGEVSESGVKLRLGVACNLWRVLWLGLNLNKGLPLILLLSF